MGHYLEVLEKSFKMNESLWFPDLLKDSDVFHDKKAMGWSDSSPGSVGSAKALFKIGTLDYRGCGVQLDKGEALKWYLAVSEAGIG
ncbi:hypothetical protein BGZ68_005994, partial [Mortierella alpina]